MNEAKQLKLDERPVVDRIMGIDLGTTNSAVAIYDSGMVPQLCPMGKERKSTMPSCVMWTGSDNFIVGTEAYEKRYMPNVCYSVKRLMDDANNEVKLTLESGESRVFSPVQISAEILKALAKNVEMYYGKQTKCIITVPAYFNQVQIENTIEASKLAGLDCIQILKEPTSASYVYSTLGYATGGSVLVYDLGGGTFDATYMDFIKKSDIPKTMISALRRMYGIELEKDFDDVTSLYYCQVKGTYGDTRLGGDDVDTELALASMKGAGVKLSKKGFEELKLNCESFKRSGAFGMEFTVEDHQISVTQEKLEAAYRKIFNKTMSLLNTMGKEALDSIKTIVLVGGSTKSEYIPRFLAERFPNKEISRVLDPDSTVALGAGTVAKDLNQGKALPYRDVLPMAIGVLLNETKVDVCVPSNSPLPTATDRTLYTMVDNQEAISLKIYQGIYSEPERCTYLGLLRIPNIPKRNAGDVSVKVSFMLSSQGRLTIVANCDGVETPVELIVDSIFNVAKASMNGSIEFKPVDDFEEGFADIIDSNPKVLELIEKRRAALKSGDTNKVEELEMSILEAM